MTFMHPPHQPCNQSCDHPARPTTPATEATCGYICGKDKAWHERWPDDIDHDFEAEVRPAYDELLQVAARLISEKGENPEYDRALAEFIADTRWGATADTTHSERSEQVLADIRAARAQGE